MKRLLAIALVACALVACAPAAPPAKPLPVAAKQAAPDAGLVVREVASSRFRLVEQFVAVRAPSSSD